MKVRCISTSLDARQKIALALPPNGIIFDNRLTVGEEYLVIGLTFELGSTNARAGVYVHVLLTNGDVAYSHLYLFEVIDPRSSRYCMCEWSSSTGSSSSNCSRQRCLAC